MSKVFSKTNLIGISLAVFLAGSTAQAMAGTHCKDNDREHSMARMIKHLDLSEVQKQKVDSILESHETERGVKKGMPKMRVLMQLNPDDADYLEQVEAHADAASEQMKAHILTMAKTRQQIHAVLTEEQKQELKELMQKKMKRMGKRYEDEREDD